MLGDKKSRKAITFDLDTTKTGLRQYYPGKNWRKAYSDIKKFMEDYGFPHRQGSCYNSDEKMPELKACAIIEKLGKECPWLKSCVKAMDITDIGDVTHDVRHLLGSKTIERELPAQREGESPQGDPAAAPPRSPSNGAIPLDGWKTEIAALREKSELAKPRSSAKQLDKKSKAER